MVNPPKQKGTAGESAVVRVCRLSGFPNAERRALSGRQDTGDVLLCPGVIIEVKTGHHAKDASYGQIENWLVETEVERVNANAAIAFLVTQRRGFGLDRAEFWTAHFTNLGDLAAEPVSTRIFNIPGSMTLHHALKALRTSGFGEAP